jgi:hypothetical protein
MYAPELRGNSDELKLEIEDTKKPGDSSTASIGRENP